MNNAVAAALAALVVLLGVLITVGWLFFGLITVIQWAMVVPALLLELVIIWGWWASPPMRQNTGD